MSGTVTLERRTVVAWLAVAAIVACQWHYFELQAVRDVTPFAPRHYDQSLTLFRAYEDYDQIERHGLVRGIIDALWVPTASSVGLPVTGAVFMSFFGPSRLAALSVNFVFFALLQCVLVATLRWWTKRWSIAFFGLGLLLCTLVPHYAIGGWTGFKVDFSGFCLFGIFVCALVRSEFFASRPWALLVGVTAAAVAGYRQITMVYLTGILGACFVFFLLRLLWRWRDTAARQIHRNQVIGVLLASLIGFLLILPFGVHNFEHLWFYYGLNCIVGGDKSIRAQEFGLFTIGSHLLYYVRSVRDVHAGMLFLLVSLGTMTLALLTWTAQRLRGAYRDGTTPRLHVGSAYGVFGICLLVPFVILTAGESKSPVVGGILVVPLVWLALMPVIGMAFYAKGALPRYLTIVFACLAIALGLWNHRSAGACPDYWFTHQEEAGRIAALHDEVVCRSLAANLDRPKVASDWFADVLIAQVFSVRAREKFGKRLDVQQIYPATVMGISREDALAGLRQCDFFMLSALEPTPYRVELYPFHQCMKEMHAEFLAYCEQEMIPIKRVSLYGCAVTLYGRPHLSVAGLSGDWITSEGVTLKEASGDLQYCTSIELRGIIRLDWLGKEPGVQVQARGLAGTTTLPASLEVQGGAYRLHIDLPRGQLPPGACDLQVTFDRYFVPHDLGIGEDTRRLVVGQPTCIQIQRH
jgi:hypothetical protein